MNLTFLAFVTQEMPRVLEAGCQKGTKTKCLFLTVNHITQCNGREGPVCPGEMWWA